MITFLKNSILICGICALLVFTFAVAAVSGKLVSTLGQVDATAHATRDTMDAAVRIVDERTAQVVETADRHLIAAREEVQATRRDLRSLADLADGRLASIQADVKATADEIVAVAGTELGRANDSIAEVAKIRGDLQLALENASATLFQVREVTDYHLNCRGNGACWPAGVTALLGGAKVTLGESALTMRTVRKEVPNFLMKFSEGIDTANRVGANVEMFTRDLTGRGHPASRVLWWGAKVKQAVPFF